MADKLNMTDAFNKLSESTKITPLSEHCVNILNEAIYRELEAAQIYLHMSSWCEFKGYTGTALFMKKHYEEELEHMHKIYSYILDKDVMPITPACPSKKDGFKDLKDVLLQALQHEKSVTLFYYKALERVLSEKDFMTFEFLQWYAEEQRDEEIVFKNFLDRLEVIGNDKRGQYFLDTEIGKYEE